MSSTTPSPLTVEHNRDATPALCGFDYQVWAAMEAWCCLDSKEAIYFEGAEDFDRVSDEDAAAIQVRLRQAKVSLGTQACLAAIGHYWDLVEKSKSDRTLRYLYLTTSEVAVEADADFGGVPGIELWRIAGSDLVVADQLRIYLLGKTNLATSLRSFLESGSIDELQQRLFRRFEWLPGQPQVEAIRESVLARLIDHPEANGLPRVELRKVRNNLLAFAWEKFTKPQLSDRILTAQILSEQIRVATTVTLSFRLQQLPTLINASVAQQLSAGASLIAAEIPPVPMPLLERTTLVDTVRNCLKRGRHTLLIGGVHRGKTTIAQLAASTFDANAWWITLAARDPSSVDFVLRSVSMMLADMGHRVVVLDDLDLEPANLKRYEVALRVLLHRATRAGKVVLVTAQAAIVHTSVFDGWAPGIEVTEIPELSDVDIAECCIAFGCPHSPLAGFWGRIVYAQTRGHPRLVYVRLIELQQRGWPQVGASDFVVPSAAVAAAKQIARQLFAKSASEVERTFIYAASEASIALSREMLIDIATSTAVAHPGDVIDRLMGRWIETVPPNRYRVTPMLASSTAGAGGSAATKSAHQKIAHGIGTTGTMSPSDGAAMLFHGFLGEDARIVVGAIKAIQLDDDSRVKPAILPLLNWIIYLQPAAGAPLFSAHPGASLMLRYLQFDVALHERSDKLGMILQGWMDEVERVPDEILRRENLAFIYLRTLGVHDRELPIGTVFGAIQFLSTAEGEIVTLARNALEKITSETNFVEAVGDKTGVRTWLALKAHVIRRLEDFQALVEWLRDSASDELKASFDEVVGWPTVQAAGAFVHSAWAKDDTDSPRWTAWIETLEVAREYAGESRSPKFGVEIAKAKSIILLEYLDDREGALRAIDEAETFFGSSPILQEQRANVFFQSSDDETVLSIFAELERSKATAPALSDPFAYRRVAISAARLKRWKESADFYFRGIDTVQRDEFSLTRIGLFGDAAFALSNAGEEQKSLTVVSEAIGQFISHCPAEIDQQWAALRAALAAVAMGILRGGPTKVTPGLVSSPNKPKLPEDADHVLALQLLATMCAEADARTGRDTAVDVETLISGTKHGLVRSEYAKAKVFRAAATDKFLARANDWGDEFLAFVAETKPSPTFGEESRFGFLVAALILAEGNAEAMLQGWITEAKEKKRAHQVTALEQLRAGMTLPQEEIRPAIYNLQSHLFFRVGACFRLLQSDQRTLIDTAGSQSLFLSIMANGLALSLFPGISQKVVKWLANGWHPLLERGFMFSQPSVTIPLLRDAVELSLQGRSSLSKLTGAITEATGFNFGSSPTYLEGHWPREADSGKGVQ